MADLSYAVVIATKNRIDALRISIPLVLAQSRAAAQIVVVDKSDDHAAVVVLCEELAQTTSIPVNCVEPPRANLAHQRNVGLEHVREDVVMFPDDDAFWYPDTAAEVMRVYEEDVNGLIGGVTGTQVHISPVADREIGIAPARLTNISWVMRARKAVESLLFPQPFFAYGDDRTKELASTATSVLPDYPLVPTMGGFRMSFRAGLVKRLGFDEVLGSRSGYSQFEDCDIAMRVLLDGSLLAAAPHARVFHNVYPSKRANGFPYGYFQIFNYMYICRKSLPEGSRALKGLKRYLRYKLYLYRLRTTDDYAREVHRGAQAAFSEYAAMMSTPRDALEAAYAEACDRNLGQRAAAVTAA